MKKTFLAKRNRLISGQHISWGAWALLFVFVVFLVRVIAPNTFWHVVAPAAQVSNSMSVGVQNFMQHFSDAASLAKENDQLTAHNAVLASQNQTLSQELASIRAILGSPAQKTPEGIVGGVVTHPPESPYDTLVVAVGSTSRVALGMEIFAAGNIPIGLVSGISNDFAQVTLFSASDSSTNGWAGTAHTPIIILGSGGGTMHAMVSRDAPVSVGDVVFVSGPGMLPIGSVTHIHTDPLSPSVDINIKPAVNIFSLGWVTIRATGGVEMQFATSTSAL